jgi:hypothetical protein
MANQTLLNIGILLLFDLSNNQISPSAADKFAEMIVHNKVITHLSIIVIRNWKKRLQRIRSEHNCESAAAKYFDYPFK